MEMCPCCMGSGRIVDWKEVARNEKTITVVSEIETCAKCNGSEFKKLKAARPKWISVEERLPEENFEVLMLFKHNMAVGWYGGEGDWYSNTDDGFYASCDGEPTHWMPLPEPEEDI